MHAPDLHPAAAHAHARQADLRAKAEHARRLAQLRPARPAAALAFALRGGTPRRRRETAARLAPTAA